MAEPLALRSITQLIVILQIRNKFVASQPERRAAMHAAPMRRVRSRVDERPLHRSGYMFERAKILVVPRALAGDQAVQGVVDVVAPLGINSEPA